MIGARAAARKKYRRMVWASHALTASREPATIALWLALFGTYQGRNTQTPRSSPPRAAINSLGPTLDGCTRRRTLLARGSARVEGRRPERLAQQASDRSGYGPSRERRTRTGPGRRAAVLVGGGHAGVRPLPRRGVGPARPGRPGALRAAVP